MNAVTSRIGYLKDLVSILRDLCNIKNSSFAHLFEYFYKKSGDNFMSSFYRKENITVCAKQGGKLEGNSTRKLLKSLDSLELELSKLSPEVYLNSLPFLRTLRAFNLVVHRCFGAVLLDGWREAIAEFTLSYSDMTTLDGKPISITHCHGPCQSVSRQEG